MADAEITIKTVDETGAGFQSVSTRFKEFDEQVGNLEKNLRPLEEILKAGVEASGALSGLGAVAKNGGNLAGAFGDLQSAFLGVKDAATEAGESLGIFGWTMQKITDFGAVSSKVFGGLMAAFEVGKQLKIGYAALKTVFAEMAAVQAAAAAASGTLGAAQVGLAAKTGICATAFRLWNYALAMNPIFAIATAAVTAGAVIFGLGAAIYHACTAEEDYAAAAERALEVTRAQNEANARKRDLLDSQIEQLKLYYELELWGDARGALAELEKAYGSLGAKVDQATGKILNFNEVLEEARRKQAQAARDDIAKELADLQNARKAQSQKFEKSKKGWIFNGPGDAEEKKKLDDLDAQIVDAQKRLNDAENAILRVDADEKRRKEAEQKEADRKAAEKRQKEEADKRAKQAENDRKSAEEQRKEEADKRAKQAENDRKKAEKEAEEKRQKAEIASFGAFNLEMDAQAERDAERRQDARWDAMDPQKVIKIVGGLLSQSQKDAQKYETEYRAKLKEFTADGVLSDKEKKTLSSYQKWWRGEIRDRDRYQARLEQAQNRLKENAKNAQDIAAAGPVESITRGSVEALRKEMALGTKNPMVEALEKAERKRDRQAKKQIELAEESVKIQRGKSKTVFKGV